MKGFWKRVKKMPNGCWEWQGAKNTFGYGGVRMFGRPERAHRVAYVLEYGRIPNNLIVCHHCDNPSCVRPDHLFLGTHQDNSDDKWSKGRAIPTGLSGEKNANARITADTVREIRKKYEEGGVTYDRLAREYGLSTTHVGQIIRRQKWPHVD